MAGEPSCGGRPYTPRMTLTHRGALAAVILGSGTVFLDSTVVNIALQRIGTELPATTIGVLEGQVYVVAGYMATLAALLIPGGAMGDLYGRRRLFVAGLILFAIASVVCGLAPTLDLLVLARIGQGVAGAVLVPGSLAIITALYEGPLRARAIGLWVSATSAMAIVGPPLGGVLVGTAGWRSIFLVNVPILAIAVVLAIRAMPELRQEGVRRSLDLPGSLAAAAAVGGLTFGAIRGQQTQWQEPIALVAIVVGIAGVVAFPLLMRRASALVPLELFRNRTFSAINLATLLVYGALYLLFYLQSLFLQSVLGYSPLGAGIAALPQGLALVLLTGRAGALATRIGARPFLIGAPLLMAVGALNWLRVTPDSAAWVATVSDPASLVPPLAFVTDVLPAITLFAIGISFLVVPLTATLMNSVPPERAGIASGINNALSRIGQPIFSAIAFILISEQFYAAIGAKVSGVDPSDPAFRAALQPLNPPATDVSAALAAAATNASADAFHLAALGCAVVLVIGAAVSAVGIRRTSIAP